MTSKSILIVDDDRNVRQSMALLLRRAGYQVETAGSADEALETLEVAPYTLIIIDVMMPDDSSVLLPRLLDLYPDQTILVLTAQTSPQTHSEIAHPGLHYRLTKPVTPETLLKRVKSILEKKAAPSDGPFIKTLL